MGGHFTNHAYNYKQYNLHVVLIEMNFPLEIIITNTKHRDTRIKY